MSTSNFRSGGHIRHLILEPGGIDEVLVGRLETIPLMYGNKLYPYEAIPYAWGWNVKNQSITVQGRTLPITSNLWGTLRQTRLKDRPVAL